MARHTTQFAKETVQICTDAVLSLDTDVSPLNVASCQLAQTTLGAADEKQLDLEEKSARSSEETRLNNVTGFFPPRFIPMAL